MFVFTTVIQAVRILAIWASCKAVGIDLGPRIYYVMGPLFFLVLLVPFTLNGFAVREAFFVSFLGSVGVDADQAFAGGFLFFLVTVALALPGGGDPAVGVGARRRPARGGAWLTRPSSSRPTTRSPGSSPASRASRATETVVVDNDSSDDTVAFVRGRFPEVRLLEQANRGLAAGWNRGLEEIPPSRWVLILNADAWLDGRRARRGWSRSETRTATSPSWRRSCSTRTGRCSDRCAASPPAGGSRPSTSTSASSARGRRLLNAFYGAASTTPSEREVECVMGACMLVRRAAIDEVGPPDAGFFLFSEEVDWCYRFAQAGWKTLFTPEATCTHVGGASHGGRLYRDNLRGHLRFFLKHHGADEAEEVRRCCTGRFAFADVSSAARGGRCTATPPAGSAPATSAR